MTSGEGESVELIRSPALEQVPHGYFGRRGGVSGGDMWGLNTGHGSGDAPELIAENRRRAIGAVLPGSRLATVHQVHSPTVVYAASEWPIDERPRADAMVTDRPGLLLGILTADCAPVLFADAEAGVVGAAHSGWRGALAGVNEATVEAMEALGASRDRIVAIVGPCIAQASYEVDDDFPGQFLAKDPANARFFQPGPSGKPHFDLAGFVRHRLVEAGVGTAGALGLDTYCDPGRFYSYRRSTHRGEPSYGRQISLVGLPGD